MDSYVLLASLVLAIGFIMYALFGGADFGGGIWTLFASGPRAEEQRDALFHAIGPVWETNHVWLIFVVVTLFTAFPTGFAALFIALMTPLVLALVGINFRGAAFAFRHFGRQSGRHVPLSARTFEIASIVTPFTLGMAVTATAAGRITITNGEIAAGIGSWANPFTVVGGLVGVAICAYLAPIYMTVRVSGELRDDFRNRGIAAGLALGALTTAEVPVALHDAPSFAERMMHPASLAVVVLAVVAGVATQIMLWRRLYRLAQLLAGATVTLTLAGFAASLYPDLLIGQLPLAAASAPRATLASYLAVLPVGAVVLVPSLALLYWTFRGRPDPEQEPTEQLR